MIYTILVVLAAFAILGYYVQKDIRAGDVSNPFAK